MEFSNDAKKYMDSLSNKSLASEAIGAASRKLNSFNVPSDEIISINLVSNFNQIKINRRSKSLGNICSNDFNFFYFRYCWTCSAI